MQSKRLLKKDRKAVNVNRKETLYTKKVALQSYNILLKHLPGRNVSIRSRSLCWVLTPRSNCRLKRHCVGDRCQEARRILYGSRISAVTSMKHELSVCYPRHVPAQHLIEGRRVIEHVTHIGHAGDILCGQVLIEGRRVVEYLIHIGHTGDIPRTNVTLKGSRRITIGIYQATHGIHSACVPAEENKRRRKLRGEKWSKKVRFWWKKGSRWRNEKR